MTSNEQHEPAGEERTPLPTDEDGFINTSAEYGYTHMVRVTYNTDLDGSVVPDDIEEHLRPATYHGPMDEDEAKAWLQARNDVEDMEVVDIDILPLNLVRPGGIR